MMWGNEGFHHHVENVSFPEDCLSTCPLPEVGQDIGHLENFKSDHIFCCCPSYFKLRTSTSRTILQRKFTVERKKPHHTNYLKKSVSITLIFKIVLKHTGKLRKFFLFSWNTKTHSIFRFNARVEYFLANFWSQDKFSYLKIIESRDLCGKYLCVRWPVN